MVWTALTEVNFAHKNGKIRKKKNDKLVKENVVTP